MGREVFDTRFLPSKLAQCRVMITMSKVRSLSIILSGILAVSAVVALSFREFLLSGLLVACLTSIMILRSLIHKAWGGPARLSETLRTVRRELEYLARLIDSRVEEHEEKVSVKKGSRKRVIRHADTTQINFLKAIRYALLLRANRMRDFLAAGSYNDIVSCFNLVIQDLPVFSGVTEKPSFKIRMEDVPHEIAILFKGVEPLVPEDREELIARAA